MEALPTDWDGHFPLPFLCTTLIHVHVPPTPASSQVQVSIFHQSETRPTRWFRLLPSGLLTSRLPRMHSYGFVVSDLTHMSTHHTRTTHTPHIHNLDATTVAPTSYSPDFPLYWIDFLLCWNKSSSNVFSNKN